jgi:2-haloacid dehalogenase
MKDIRGIVFDLYGTLYDVHSVAEACEGFYPRRGRELSVLWRQKQLEYTWLRSLMKQYLKFEQITEDALKFSCTHLGLPLDDLCRATLCDAYLHLQPHPEVPAALNALKALGLPLAILSNGSAQSINAVVRHSGLLPQFDHLLSVDDVQVFKPNPKVYELAERRLSLPRASVLFVSSNAWDATGAAHYGYTTCWVQRGHATFDEMGQRPAYTVAGIDEIAPMLQT